MLECEVVETCYHDDETQQDVLVYGFRFYVAGNKKISVKVVPDVFCRQAQAVLAMQQINEYGISPLHIEDILADFLA